MREIGILIFRKGRSLGSGFYCSIFVSSFL